MNNYKTLLIFIPILIRVMFLFVLFTSFFTNQNHKFKKKKLHIYFLTIIHNIKIFTPQKYSSFECEVFQISIDFYIKLSQR